MQEPHEISTGSTTLPKDMIGNFGFPAMRGNVVDTSLFFQCNSLDIDASIHPADGMFTIHVDAYISVR